MRQLKRAATAELGEALEAAAVKGQQKEVWRLLDELCGPAPKRVRQQETGGIRAADGRLITGTRRAAERLAEHFHDVLNRGTPVTAEVLASLQPTTHHQPIAPHQQQPIIQQQQQPSALHQHQPIGSHQQQPTTQ
jgi:uncharacterized protein YbjT (DUF2867 family)